MRHQRSGHPGVETITAVRPAYVTVFLASQYLGVLKNTYKAPNGPRNDFGNVGRYFHHPKEGWLVKR